jgi:hypothetical protein
MGSRIKLNTSNWQKYSDSNLGAEHDFDYLSIVIHMPLIELRFEFSFHAVCNWNWVWEADLSPPCDWEPICLRLNLPTLFFVFTVFSH